MKSYFLQNTETESRLELRDVPRPEPKPGQLLVRVRAASLNRGELLRAHGVHKQGAAKPAGMDGAGEVEGTGERVMGRLPGAFAEYALMDKSDALAVPKNMSWEDAAATPVTFLVVYDMLAQQGQLKAGEWLLVTGVSSGVGVAALQLGKVLGARVIGTSGSREKLDALKDLGLDVGLCTRAADFAPAVMEATGQKGADLAINSVGGSVFAEDVRCLAFEGRLAVVGYVDGVLHADFDLETVHAKRLAIFGVSNKLRTKAQKSASIPRFTTEILPHMAAGRIVPRVDKVFPFEQMREAKAMMEAGGHLGKIVLRMPG